MSLSKDTVQIQFTKTGIGWQILHFCHTIVGEIDLLDRKKNKQKKKQQHTINIHSQLKSSLHLTQEILQINP